MTYCDRCGGALAAAPYDAHRECAAQRRYEPPRFCAQCRRRLVVQVTPSGWTAQCSEHGTTISQGAP